MNNDYNLENQVAQIFILHRSGYLGDLE